jgi:hypothetical protein
MGYSCLTSLIVLLALRNSGDQHETMVPTGQTQKAIFWREFICLWTISVTIGLLQAALIRMPSSFFARQLLIPIPTKSSFLILVATIIQDCIWLAIVIGVGLIVARKIGLGVPLLEAWLKREPVRQRLRESLIPIGITIIVLVGASALAGASWFRPKRAQNAAITDEFLKSPETEKAFNELEQLGLGGGTPLTPMSQVILNLNQALESELNGRLFEVSVVILLLVQFCRRESGSKNWQVIWIAVLLVGAFHTVENVMTMHQNTLLVARVFHKYGLPHDIPPIGQAFARTGMRVIPSAAALGLLYVYCGVEASFVANFCAGVLSHMLTIFWLTHFR